MKINKLVLIAMSIFPFIAEAAVRELGVSNHEMGHIYLKMGKSTVLRFLDKPKKVVIGNQNYFNVEFIENDVTIQPLGETTTNLFVYGEHQTYGLILNVRASQHYDDLVLVKRKITQLKNNLAPSKESETKNVKVKLNYKGKLGKSIGIEIIDMFYHNDLKTFVLDFIVKNESGKILLSKDINLVFSRNNKPLEIKNIIFDSEATLPNIEKKARVLFSDGYERFTFHITTMGKEWKQVIKTKNMK